MPLGIAYDSYEEAAEAFRQRCMQEAVEEYGQRGVQEAEEIEEEETLEMRLLRLEANKKERKKQWRKN